MRLALFTNKFPIQGDTFLARDVRSLMESGITVDIFPMHPVDPELWRWVPEILNEEVYPRSQVHGTSTADILRSLAPLRAKSLTPFAKDVLAVGRSALRFGGGPFARSSYALLVAWSWAARFGSHYDHMMSYWGNYAATCARVAHRLTGREIPFSVLLHAGTDLYRNQVFMREKLTYADNIFVVCEFNREFIRNTFPDIFPSIEEKIFVHHLGLDFREFPFTRPGRFPRTALGVGRFDKQKGFDRLLLAAADLARQGDEVRVELVGDGDERGALEGLARDLGIAERVRFSGWLPFRDVRAAMMRATVLVHPSTEIGDAVPTVIKEAAALGTPVIASDVAGIPELLDQGRCGMLVPPGDARALAGALRTLFNDDVLRDMLARKARTYAERTMDLWINGKCLAERLRATKRKGVRL